MFGTGTFDVIQEHLAVHRLADVHPPLPVDADRAIAEQVTEEPRERQRAQIEARHHVVGQADQVRA